MATNTDTGIYSRVGVLFLYLELYRTDIWYTIDMKDTAKLHPDDTNPEGNGRESDGRWRKGVSGNPGGQPAGLGEMRKLCRTHTDAAIARLVQLMDSEDARVARAACCNILDRGWGTPGTMVEDVVEDTAVTKEDLQQVIGELVERKANVIPFPTKDEEEVNEE